jgi:hypothetical protein
MAPRGVIRADESGLMRSDHAENQPPAGSEIRLNGTLAGRPIALHRCLCRRVEGTCRENFRPGNETSPGRLTRARSRRKEAAGFSRPLTMAINYGMQIELCKAS